MKQQDAPQLPKRTILEVKTSRTGEETVESMVQFLASLTSLKRPLIGHYIRFGIPFSLEIVALNQTVRFYITIPQEHTSFIESQLISQYPKALVSRTKDYMEDVLEPKTSLMVGQLKLLYDRLYPIRSFRDFKDVDPLSSLLGMLSKLQPTDKVVIQYLAVPIGNSWQKAGESAARSKHADSTGAQVSNPYAKVIMEKIAVNGFKAAVRLAVNSESPVRSKQLLSEIANSFSSFNNPSANSLIFKRPILWQRERLIKVMRERSRFFMPSHQILNVEELATLYHFPTEKLSKIHNIAWHKTIHSEPPEQLPVAETLQEGERGEVNFFARTEFKNKMTNFGIRSKDRRRHVYVIGKTGAGKSTLIANMAIDDMRNRRGFAVIDPHGDLCEILLNYVPSYRVNDVVYLDPSDPDFAFGFNPLEVQMPHQKELVVSGIVAIFHKMYGTSWGPRLEYILRNTILSIIDLPDATMLMIPEMLSNDEFRKKVIPKIQDPILRNYWEYEFANYTDKLRAEALAPIQNKVGQFISSQTIRRIVSQPKSTIDLEKIMNEGKILLLNLSQGKLGEDNAALLGAMTITKLQLAAMNRVNQKEDDRRDFYLYVDEFQNFATSSFIKILSEARKYRLNLILANQYIAQIPEDVRSAIFGNAATMLSFLIGAQDTPFMAKEFSERFKEEDLLALQNYQAIIKLCIDNISTSPFLCYTLPLPQSRTQNREKVIKISRERYMKPAHKLLEAKIPQLPAVAASTKTDGKKDENQDVREERGEVVDQPSVEVSQEKEEQQEQPQLASGDLFDATKLKQE
jgi:hypothetical protein